MLLILLTLVAGGANDCRCGCVNGQALTLCTTVAAAQRREDLCPAEMRCPAAVDDSAGTPLPAPEPAAESCRRIAVWNAGEQRYIPRNLCDVLASDP